MTAIDAFRESMADYGLHCPDTIIPDGKIHRFHVAGDKAGTRNGWYVLYGGDGVPAGAFGSWKLGGETFNWCAKSLKSLSDAEQEQWKLKVAKAKKARDQEQEKFHAKAREKAQTIWRDSKPITEHPYLTAKGVKSYGLRQYEDFLIILIRDTKGITHSLQLINSNGDKRFLPGSAITGHFSSIDGNGDILPICEGYSTGATLREATGYPIACALNCGNLKPVCEALRKKSPDTKLILCSDDDYQTPGNPGLRCAKEAAKAVGASVAIPKFEDPAHRGTDFNDLGRIEGLEAVRRQIEEVLRAPDEDGELYDGCSDNDESVERTPPKKVKSETGFSASKLMTMELPEPKWAIPNILPEGLNILAGKPKMGKSVLSLNIALSIASGGKALSKINVEKGAVLYLALEDTKWRLKNRIKAMLQGRSAPENLHFETLWPKIGDGGLAKLDKRIQEITNLRLLIIDTLKKIKPIQNSRNRNPYDIDYENISVVKALADKFNISILVIHHLRKTESEDIMDDFSGTFGLTGAADGLLALKRKTGQSSAELHLIGRDVDAAEYALKYHPDIWAWELLGDAQEVKATRNLQATYDAIKESEEDLTPKQITQISGVKYRTVTDNLKSLLNDGSIRKIDHGKYKIF